MVSVSDKVRNGAQVLDNPRLQDKEMNSFDDERLDLKVQKSDGSTKKQTSPHSAQSSHMEQSAANMIIHKNNESQQYLDQVAETQEQWKNWQILAMIIYSARILI